MLQVGATGINQPTNLSMFQYREQFGRRPWICNSLPISTLYFGFYRILLNVLENKISYNNKMHGVGKYSHECFLCLLIVKIYVILFVR
jgi:hypothetical protein